MLSTLVLVSGLALQAAADSTVISATAAPFLPVSATLNNATAHMTSPSTTPSFNPNCQMAIVQLGSLESMAPTPPADLGSLVTNYTTDGCATPTSIPSSLTGEWSSYTVALASFYAQSTNAVVLSSALSLCPAITAFVALPICNVSAIVTVTASATSIAAGVSGSSSGLAGSTFAPATTTSTKSAAGTIRGMWIDFVGVAVVLSVFWTFT